MRVYVLVVIVAVYLQRNVINRPLWTRAAYKDQKSLSLSFAERTFPLYVSEGFSNYFRVDAHCTLMPRSSWNCKNLQLYPTDKKKKKVMEIKRNRKKIKRITIITFPAHSYGIANAGNDSASVSHIRTFLCAPTDARITL